LTPTNGYFLSDVTAGLFVGVKGSLHKVGMTPFFYIFFGRDMANQRVRCLGLRMTGIFYFIEGVKDQS